MTTDTPMNKCLHCGYVMDAATGANPEDRPDEGSLSVCIQCGAVAMFTKDLRLRGLRDHEIAQLKAHPEVLLDLYHLIQGRFFFLREQIKEPS